MKRYTILLSIVLASCSAMHEAEQITESDNIVNVGDQLPTFAVCMNDGTTLTTDDLRGKPSVIVFFSTTCSDCQRELPGINERYMAHGADTTFVAIGREQAAEEVAAYWTAQSLSLPYSAQTDRTIYSMFARKGIPRIYISDATCKVLQIVLP